jgi:hypothetical protein
LESKGLFTLIFSYTKDIDKVFYEGPYLFNSVGLHLRYWRETFSPEKEDYTTTLVWIRLYYLPQEFRHLKKLEETGNTIVSFVKNSEITKMARYIYYTRICVYTYVAGPLSELIVIYFQDDEWV